MIAQPQIFGTFKFFAGRDIPRSAGAVAGAIASPAILAQGELVVTDESNVILDTTTVLTAPKVKIVMGRGVDIPLLQTEAFTYSELLSYNGLAYAAKVQQVSYLGYDAVANVGSFEVLNNNYYTLVVSFYELVSQEASALMNPAIVEYYSDSTATQEEIANGLFKQMVKQLSYWVRKPILVELVSSAASVALTGTATTLAFATGSTTVTLNGTITNVAVGDYLRVSPDVTVNDLDAVYRVVAINSPTSITLEVPFQATGFAAPVIQVQVIAAATAQAGNFGMRFTGLNQPFILDSRPVSLVQFKLGLQKNGNDVSTTRNSLAVSPFLGHGTYELMRTQEASSWRMQGILYNYTEFPPTSIPTDLVTTQNYSTLDVVWGRTQLGLNNSNFGGSYTIACALDSNVPSTFDTNYTGAATSFIDVLDAYAALNPALTTQLGNL